MRAVKIVLLTMLVAALCTATAYGAGYAAQHWGDDGSMTASEAPTADATNPVEPTTDPTTEPTDVATVEPVKPTAKPKPKPKPTLEPGPTLLASGDTGDQVRDLQARLKQIAWLTGPVTSTYDATTVTAIRGFQAKREIPVTGEVDQRTIDRLHQMTRTPTHDELHNIAPASSSTSARLDPRCTTGRALCIDKSSRTVRWVVDGKVRQTLDVRFGSSATPTREGQFQVDSKSRDHVSSLFDSPMPYAMFFSRGQAVHFSSDFAARGYNGASHGCVNVRDEAGIAWLYDQVSVGDKVIVYWS